MNDYNVVEEQQKARNESKICDVMEVKRVGIKMSVL
jgi:hypothetical protein